MFFVKQGCQVWLFYHTDQIVADLALGCETESQLEYWIYLFIFIINGFKQQNELAPEQKKVLTANNCSSFHDGDQRFSSF